MVDQLAEIVSQLRKMNVSILVAEQSVKFALAVSDDCYILEKGNVVLHKPTAELTPRGDTEISGHVMFISFVVSHNWDIPV